MDIFYSESLGNESDIFEEQQEVNTFYSAIRKQYLSSGKLHFVDPIIHGDENVGKLIVDEISEDNQIWGSAVSCSFIGASPPEESVVFCREFGVKKAL